MASNDYLLGADDVEIQRLRHQHSVWKPVTEALFDRIGVGAGWHCLDAGSGPGFVTADLRERVGASGTVTALDQSPEYLGYLREEARRLSWENVNILSGTVEETALPSNAYDLVFSRWVLSFSPDPARYIERLLSSVKPGGYIAVQDYYYEGLSLFPFGGAFDRTADVVRAYYNQAHGDPYVSGKLPGIFRRLGMELVEFHPNCLAGGPGSGVMDWATRFFNLHMGGMVESGAVTKQGGKEILADLEAHWKNPDSVFFSPIVVDITARKPA